MKIMKIVCPFLCFVLCACSSQSIKTNIDPRKEIGETICSEAVEKNYVLYIEYPKTSYALLDNAIYKFVSSKETSFLNKVKQSENYKKAEFNISYESFYKDDRYISIVLSIYENIQQKQEGIKTIVYDRKKDKILSLLDLYDEQKLNLLSQRVITHFKEEMKRDCDNDQFRIHSSAIASNFQHFALKKKGIQFYFPQHTLFDDSVTYEISYRDLDEAIDLKEEASTTLVPYDDILNEPVKNIDPKKPMVALTFDDGPHKRYTASILDVLKEYGASATFFVLGSNTINEASLLQRMVLEGNEIGNHTFSHKQLTTLSKENIEEEISATQESIYHVTHAYPKLIRPPYGSKNKMVLQCAQGKRFVNWSLDTRDWKDRNAKVVVDRVLRQVKDGDIILMHDLYASSAQAATILIPQLQEMGYQLVTVSDLYDYKKIE